MIKLKRVVTDKGFILEEIDKVNKKLIDDGSIKPIDLPHVENNPQSVQDHIDAVKKIVDKEKEEMEKKALETKSEDRAIFAESKFFKDRGEMSSFIVKLKEQKIKHRVLPLHEDKEGYRFELKYEKPLDESLNESYETAFEVCEDGSKVSAVGSFKHTKNYTHELVDFDCASGSGSGDYRWMNRPWQRFTFAEALREAMINAGVNEKFAREIIEESYSLKNALKLFADRYSEEEAPIKEDVNAKRCKEILNKWVDWDDVDKTGDVDFARNQLRSLNAEGTITNDEYDYINKHWDELLTKKIEKDSNDSNSQDKEFYKRIYIIDKDFDNAEAYTDINDEDDKFYRRVIGGKSVYNIPKKYVNSRKPYRGQLFFDDETLFNKSKIESLKEDVTYYAVYIDKDGNEEPQEGSESRNREDVEDLIADWTARDACEDGCRFEVRTKNESLKEDKEEPKLETFDEQMDFLASDEQEAIDGYEKVLALVEDEHVKAQLEKILEEERAHKDFLEKVKEDPSLEYSHEHEEEQDDSFDDLDGEEIVDVEEDDFDWEPPLEESKEKEDKKEDMWDFSEEDD